jgi:type VI secretion system protein ImpL
MQLKWENLGAVALGIFVLMLVWFVAPIFHVTGANALVLRGGILLLGVIGIIGLLLWARSKRPAEPAPAAEEKPAARPITFARGGSDDIDILVREAAGKVAAARLAAGAKLSSLPVVFLLGESGSGKTSTMDQSGLDAELLAGHVFQESSIVPTRIANLWFARKTVFVEAGGPLVDDSASWIKLIRCFVPGRFRAIFSGAKLAPRAVVVCVDCEQLLHEASLDKVVAHARKLRARLEELSYHMGVSLPVYVIFTRSDRIPYFEEFVGSFTNEETSQVLGMTLPIAPPTGAGVYAEQETRRLTAAFQGLFFSLAECRPGLLSRERNNERQAAVYEFPREFGKLSKTLVQFLVDLCRPGHLRSGPFLRGFYFVGQRIITVATAGSQTMLGPAAALPKAPGGFSADATSLLSAQEPTAKMSWATGTQLEGAGESRKATQRVFLNHIFSHIILQDRAALGTSGASTRGDLGRRILLAAVAGVFFVWMIALLVSFVGNSHLVSGVRQAALDLSLVTSPGTQVPAIESLRRLDTLRQSLVQLRDYKQNGAPLHLRWGLFSGDAIFDDARAIYFHSFDTILFQHTKQNLLTDLRGYRGDPQASADSGSAYDALKAYLLTTSEWQRNSGEFLQNFLMKEWRKDLGDLDQDHSDLAAKQFAFYSSELTIDNPYSKANESFLVDQVRAYLNKLAGPQRIYLSMLADARQKTKDYRFAAAHPEAADVLKVTHDVSGAFTADGWRVMDDNMKNAKRFLQGEPWVLGTTTNTNLSAADLEAQLRAMYEKDFIAEWRAVLNNSAVVQAGGYSDAAQKLKKLSENSSPLLALFCDVSDNTNVPSDKIKLAFQAPQLVVAPGCGAQKKYNQPTNDPYMKGLLNVQICTQQIADAPADQRDALKASCGQSATQALLTADQMAQTFTNDPEGHLDTTTRVLLEEPIKGLQRRIAAGAGSAEALCGPYKPLQSAYPFNAHGAREASLQELNAFFQPGSGALSRFVTEQKSAIVLQGTSFVRAPGGSTPVGNGFLRFLNEMYAIQQAVYPNNSPDPHFEYTVSARLPEVGGFKNEKLNFDGQEMAIGGSGATKKFTWPGSAQKANLSLNSGGGDLDLQTTQGLWAVARFFGGYKWQPSGNGYSIQGPLFGPTGQPVTSGGRAVEVRFQVEFKGVPLFQAGFLSSYSCPANMKQ